MERALGVMREKERGQPHDGCAEWSVINKLLSPRNEPQVTTA